MRSTFWRQERKNWNKIVKYKINLGAHGSTPRWKEISKGNICNSDFWTAVKRSATTDSFPLKRLRPYSDLGISHMGHLHLTPWCGQGHRQVKFTWRLTAEDAHGRKGEDVENISLCVCVHIACMIWKAGQVKHGKSLLQITELGEKSTRRKQLSECLQLLSQMNSASHSNDSDQGFTTRLPPTFSSHCLERPDPAAVRKLPSAAAVVHRKGPVPGADS